MKKVEIQIPGAGAAWGTLKTKYPADSSFVQPNELTGETKNLDTSVKGIVTKRKDSVLYNPTDFGAPPKDQYEAIFTSGERHLLVVAGGDLKYSSGGGTFADVASYSPNGNFEFTIYDDRVYFSNGIDNPQVYDLSPSYGGATPVPVPAVKDMGPQAPTTAVDFDPDSSGGNVPDGGHRYTVTFLYYDNEESNPGPVSALRTVAAPNNTVNLIDVPIGGYGVTARKIYRDDNDGVYRLVGTIPNNTDDTFEDTASTGTAVVQIDRDPPPNFRYIITHLDRNWIAGIAGDPSALMFSDPGMPNTFPASNFILCNPKDPITGLYVFNDRVIVFNRSSIGQILGTTKDTFRYSEIPSSIGCVDNRSIQIITRTGVPVLMWLSDKGFYQFNGSSVNYVSDPIEDTVNLNIQQSQQVKGQNAQTTKVQFDAGTASPSIKTDFGLITVDNPQRVWDDEGDWEGGSSLTNVATKTGNQLRVPIRHAPTLNSGSFSNTQNVSNTVRTPIMSDFTGQNFKTGTSFGEIRPHSTNPGGFPLDSNFALISRVFQKFTVPRACTITQVVTPHTQFIWANNAPAVYSFELRNDQLGSPGPTILHSQSLSIDGTGHSLFFQQGGVQWLITSPGTNQEKTVAMSVSLAAGTYWLGIGEVQPGYPNNKQGIFANIQRSNLGSAGDVKVSVGSLSFLDSSNTNRVGFSYTVTQAPVASSGQWTGPSYDTLSLSAISASVEHTGTYPTSTSAITTVEAADNATFTTGLVSETFNNLNGVTATTLSGKRYWRIKYNLSTTDDRVTAQLGPATLKFNTTGTWISDPIDHTTDITTLDSLINVESTPSGTSVTTEVATSPDNLVYSPFTSIGSATPDRYSKVRITLQTNSDNSVTPAVTSSTLKWTVQGNLVSSVIDTGNTPAGWDIFQAASALNGGSLVFEMRTADTVPNLSSATWFTVLNGSFPAIPVEKYAQWRVTLTASANAVPIVDSVTVNWFISFVDSIRVASLFYNRSYYLAAAEFNQTANNLLLVFDPQGMWRIYKDLSVNTLSFFFNDPYFGSSTEGKVYRFDIQSGNPVELVLDTKEFELGYPDKTKIMRNIRINGNNTGAVYYVQFSPDGGQTWVDTIDPYTGLNNLVTPNDGKKFSQKFVPVYQEGLVTAGKTLKIRVKESTAAEVELESIKAEMWIRAGERDG